MTHLKNILWLMRSAFTRAQARAVGSRKSTGESRLSPLRRLRRVVNSARGHQQQEQRAFALVLCFQAAVLPPTHDDLAGGVMDPPLPSRSAALCENHLEHHYRYDCEQNGFAKNALFLHNRTDSVFRRRSSAVLASIASIASSAGLRCDAAPPTTTGTGPARPGISQPGGCLPIRT